MAFFQEPDADEQALEEQKRLREEQQAQMEPPVEPSMDSDPVPDESKNMLVDAIEGVGYGIQEGFENMANVGSMFGLYEEVDFDLIDAPETFVGSILGDAAQIGVGFLPAMGIAGALGKVSGALSQSGRAVRGITEAAEFASKYVNPAGINRGLQAANAAKDLTATTKFVGAALLSEGTASALAYEGTAGRMADVLKGAGLDNAYTDFLSSKDDDTEVEARFKNAIEGSVLGAIAGPALIGGAMAIAKGMRKYMKASDSLSDAAAENLRTKKVGKGDQGEFVEVQPSTLRDRTERLNRTMEDFAEASGAAAQQATEEMADELLETMDFAELFKHTFVGGDSDERGRDWLNNLLFNVSGRGEQGAMVDFLQVAESSKSMDEAVARFMDKSGDAYKSREVLTMLSEVGDVQFTQTWRTNQAALKAALDAKNSDAIIDAAEALQQTAAMRPFLAMLRVPGYLENATKMGARRIKDADQAAKFASDEASLMGQLEVVEKIEDPKVRSREAKKVNDKLNKIRAENAEYIRKDANAVTPEEIQANQDMIADAMIDTFGGDPLMRQLQLATEGLQKGNPGIPDDSLGALTRISDTLQELSTEISPERALRSLRTYANQNAVQNFHQALPEMKANSVLSLGGTLYNAAAATFGSTASILVNRLATSKAFLRAVGATEADERVIQRGVRLLTQGQMAALSNMKETMGLFAQGFKTYGSVPNYLAAASRTDRPMSSFRQWSAMGTLEDRAGHLKTIVSKVARSPLDALGRLDNAFGMATGNYDLRMRAFENFMEIQGMSVGKASRMANEVAKNAMGSVVDQAGQARALRAQGEIGGWTRVPESAVQGGNRSFIGMSADELDAVANAVTKTKVRTQRSTATLPLTPDEGSGLSIKDTNWVKRFGAWTTRSISNKPVLEMLIQFVKTNTNVIASTVYDPTIGAASAWSELMFRKSVRKNLTGDLTGGKALAGAKSSLLKRLSSNDPEEAAIAATQMAVSFPLVGTAVAGGTFMAMRDDSGAPVITGAAPKDRALAKAWRDMGIQEYSIWDPVGQKYVRYNRLDPVGGTISTLVDMAYTLENLSDNIGDDAFGAAVGDLIMDVSATVANNISKHVGAESFQHVMEIVNGDSSRGAPDVFARELMGLLPLAGTVRDASGFTESMLGENERAEISSTLDLLQTRYGGGTSGVRRDILGSKVTGSGLDYATRMRTSPVSDKVIMDELYDHMHAYQRMSSTYKGGVDLTDPQFDKKGQSAWDRAQELSGSIKIGGKTLRQAIRVEIKSDSYQQLDPLGSDFGPSPRAARISKILQRYRRRALVELEKERPELRKAARARREAEARRRRGLTL